MFNLREIYAQSPRKLYSISAKFMLNLRESYAQSPRKLCSISAKFMFNLREIYVQSRRGGSNEYPQSMFWAEIRNIMYTPVNPSFTM